MLIKNQILLVLGLGIFASLSLWMARIGYLGWSQEQRPFSLVFPAMFLTLGFVDSVVVENDEAFEPKIVIIRNTDGLKRLLLARGYQYQGQLGSSATFHTPTGKLANYSLRMFSRFLLIAEHRP